MKSGREFQTVGPAIEKATEKKWTGSNTKSINNLNCSQDGQ